MMKRAITKLLTIIAGVFLTAMISFAYGDEQVIILSHEQTISLLMEAIKYSNYTVSPFDAKKLEIRLVPHSVIEANVCKAPCPILAYYSNYIVYLDNIMHVDTKVIDTGFAIHEIVHFLQHMNHVPKQTCDDKRFTEREAYTAQDKFLRAHGYRFGGIEQAVKTSVLWTSEGCFK